MSDSPCLHGDETCPCQDGDLCHYVGPDPMACPKIQAGEWCGACAQEPIERLGAVANAAKALRDRFRASHCREDTPHLAEWEALDKALRAAGFPLAPERD